MCACIIPLICFVLNCEWGEIVKTVAYSYRALKINGAHFNATGPVVTTGGSYEIKSFFLDYSGK